jgi:signal transduction histidine kinase
MNRGSRALNKWLEIALGVSALAGLYFVSLYSYLLFHSLVEIFSIIVACVIFGVSWNTRRFADNPYFVLIGVSYLVVGVVDLMHTLAYKGMGVFPAYSANLPTQLWIAARYLQSLSLLAAGLFLDRRLRPVRVLILYLSILVLLFLLLFVWPVFPDCYVEGQGLTPFKKVSEYVISAIVIGAIGILVRRRRRFDRQVFRLLVWSLALMVVAELALTLYADVYGLSNLVGHYFKLVSFYLTYKALVQVSLTQPYEVLFRDLKTSEEQLRVYAERLEEMVAERTEELREAQEQLVRRERLAVMGQMAGSVGHELRNPLGVITAAIYYLRDVLSEAEEDVARVLEIIDNEAQEASKITRDLLDFAGTRQADRKAVSVSDLLQDALERANVPERVQVEVDVAPEMPDLWVDPQQIGRQALVNLIVNAYEAMPDGGQLTIVAQGAGEAAASPAAIAVRIQDTGCGIPGENLTKIFEPLFTTKAGGIGLGLTVVKHLIELNGGSIEVESVEGEGTTFTVYLPAVGGKS